MQDGAASTAMYPNGVASELVGPFRGCGFGRLMLATFGSVTDREWSQQDSRETARDV